MTALSELTTMRVGGPALRLVEPADADQLVGATLEAWGSGEPWLILGGGSNLVVSDEGFDGTVIRVATRGIEEVEGSKTHLRIQAGEPWDALVATTIERGLSVSRHSPASRGRLALHRSRTSAPTGRNSPTAWSPSTSSTS